MGFGNILHKGVKEKRSFGNFPAIVLSAGLGSRFRPLTDFLPKPLAPICGKALILSILENIFSIGSSDIVVNLHHKPEQIKESLRGKFARKIFFSLERKILGTGGALLNCKDFLSKNDFFLLHNGDIISNAKLDELIEFHLKSGLTGTLLLIDGPENKISLRNGRICGVKDICGVCEDRKLLTYSGLAVFDRKAFDFFPKNRSVFPLTEVFSRMIEKGELGGYCPSEIYWRDIGSIEKYFAVHEEILLKRLFQPSWLDIDDIPFSKSFKKSFNGVSISGFVSLSEGADCEIRKGAKLENCILLDGAKVGFDEYRRNEIIGRGFSVHRDSNFIMNLALFKPCEFRDLRISSLQEQGSSRLFYRLRNGKKSQVLMISASEPADFDRFLKLGRYFEALRLGTAKIYKADSKTYSIFTEDLGDTTLNKALRIDEKNKIALFKKTIRYLVKFQNKTFASARTAVDREFGFNGLRWESEYFRDNFLAKFANLNLEEFQGIEDEFDIIARKALESPQLLCHRDFQSQNIMLKNGQIRIVDFQGARIGPMAYDLMSLLRDAYIELGEDEIEALMEYYFEEFSRSQIGGFLGLTEGDFAKFASVAGLQRNMQALGAFSFLGLVKGKASYLSFIPRGVFNLRKSIEIYIKTYGEDLKALSKVLVFVSRQKGI